MTLQPTAVAQDETVPNDIPSFIDKVSYIGPSTNAGMQVFFFFFTLVTGPRRSLSLKLSDTQVYEP